MNDALVEVVTDDLTHQSWPQDRETAANHAPKTPRSRVPTNRERPAMPEPPPHRAGVKNAFGLSAITTPASTDRCATSLSSRLPG